MTALSHVVELRFYDSSCRTEGEARDTGNLTRTGPLKPATPHTVKRGVWARPYAHRAALRYVDNYPRFEGSVLDRLRDYEVRFDQAILDAAPQSIDLHDGDEVRVVNEVQQVSGNRDANLLLSTEVTS